MLPVNLGSIGNLKAFQRSSQRAWMSLHLRICRLGDLGPASAPGWFAGRKSLVAFEEHIKVEELGRRPACRSNFLEVVGSQDQHTAIKGGHYV